MRLGILLLGIVLVSGALIFQNQYNSKLYDQAISDPSSFVKSYPDYYKSSQTYNILFWIAIILGGILTLNGLIGESKRRRKSY